MSVLRTPAEWESHDALWLALPHDRQEWGAYYDDAVATVLQIANEVTANPNNEKVRLLVTETSAALPSSVAQTVATYGDIWLRDTAPLFLYRDNALVSSHFRFNGWGEKFVFPHDTEVAAQVADLAGCPLTSIAMVLEGGAIECNGNNTFLTTRQCALNTNRNPGLSERDIEKLLETNLGSTQVIWLDEGLVGDHTDGHVDNIARFVAPNRVVCMLPSIASEPSAHILWNIHQRLCQSQNSHGALLDVVSLPSPGLITGPDGIMAASYCNFLLTNASVLMPVFQVPSDEEAIQIIAELFPTREIIPIPSYALLTGGGTVHCISKEQPIAP